MKRALAWAALVLTALLPPLVFLTVLWAEVAK